MFYKNDWLQWFYNDVKYASPNDLSDIFDLRLIKTIDRPILSYFDELLTNARTIRDTFGNNLDLLFSGGIDSEVILRCYIESGIPINVYIFRYTGNENYKEYNHAKTVCDNLNVKYKSIDFDLKKFFENDAEHIWNKCFANSSGWLPHCKMTEYCDGIPIIGSGEPYWKKTKNDQWFYQQDKGSKMWAIYHKTINRPCIAEWYEYSPEIMLSYTKLPFVKNLMENKIPGKLSTVSSKTIIHKEFWPDIQIRQKMTGFEEDRESGYKPEYMLEFEKNIIGETAKDMIFHYSLDELEELL